MKRKIIDKRKEVKRGIQKLHELVAKKQKTFKEEELRTTKDSIYRLSENVRIVGELFEDQEKAIGRRRRGVDEE